LKRHRKPAAKVGIWYLVYNVILRRAAFVMGTAYFYARGRGPQETSLCMGSTTVMKQAIGLPMRKTSRDIQQHRRIGDDVYIHPPTRWRITVGI
jgi:hypothetical protein